MLLPHQGTNGGGAAVIIKAEGLLALGTECRKAHCPQ